MTYLGAFLFIHDFVLSPYPRFGHVSFMDKVDTTRLIDELRESVKLYGELLKEARRLLKQAEQRRAQQEASPDHSPMERA